MSGTYQILDNRDTDGFGDISIIKADPKRNMVWSTYVQDVGDMDYAVEIVTVLNEHQRRLETELVKEENVISENSAVVTMEGPPPGGMEFASAALRQQLLGGKQRSHG